MPRVAFLQFGFDKAATGACKKIGLERFIQILRQSHIGGDKAVLQQGCLDRKILAAKGHAVADGAGGMADLQLEIP